MARIDANEKTVRSEDGEMLPGASSGLTAKSRIVAGQITRN
jgi:hypothetical protein